MEFRYEYPIFKRKIVFTSDDVLKLLSSFVIGLVIGLEREYRSKSAGLRTIILITLGATIFTILALKLNPISADRIIANIATGIGFLGAGVIFKEEKRSVGLTTAAAIWAAASLGTAAGLGLYLLAFAGMALILIVLWLFLYLQEPIGQLNHNRVYRICCSYKSKSLNRYEKIFKKYHLHFIREKQSMNQNTITGIWDVQGSEKNHQKCIDELLTDPEIKELDF